MMDGREGTVVSAAVDFVCGSNPAFVTRPRAHHARTAASTRFFRGCRASNPQQRPACRRFACFPSAAVDPSCLFWPCAWRVGLGIAPYLGYARQSPVRAPCVVLDGWQPSVGLVEPHTHRHRRHTPPAMFYGTIHSPDVRTGPVAISSSPVSTVRV